MADNSIYKNSGMRTRDMQVVIRFFELEASQWAEEDYAQAHHYRDVYSTENFSRRVQEQMAYYPGMQSASPGSTSRVVEDPFKTNAQKMGDQTLNAWGSALSSPESFMSGLKTREADIDYTTMFQGDAKDVASNVASAVAECIPCFDRIFDGAQLLPDGNLLEIHLLNIKLRTDLLDQLTSLFKNPGFNVNICELLNLLSHLCPQDLLAILSLLSQYLAKLNLDFKFNLDLLIELIGPILSPFLSSLTEWLDKWVQMILAPIICIIDHINSTIYIAQQFKLPLSESSVNLDYHAGVSAPNVLEHVGGFSQAQSNSGVHTNLGTGYTSMFNEYDPFIYGYTNNEVFNIPDKEKYNPLPPELPEEEIALANAQIENDLGITPDPNNAYENMTVEERRKMWDQIKTDYWKRKNIDLPPPLKDSNPKDGSKWSPNNIPLSEKATWNHSFNGTYDTTSHPPENQKTPKSADQYYIDPGVIVDPIIQMRNIVIAGVRYVQDWFEWATQMIYDLLGTEFGWMKKKMDNTMLKSRIIQIIMMIRAILQAVARNGLECGVNSNFDSGQLRFILEDVMNKISPYKFKANTDGTFEMTLPSTASGTAAEALSTGGADQTSGEVISSENTTDTPSTIRINQLDGIEIQEIKPETSQLTVESGIIIKDCLKRVRSDELKKVREWIADFEGRSNGV
jgi:hypothetical protein